MRASRTKFRPRLGEPCYTRPFLEDERQLIQIAKQEGKKRGDVLRGALHDWLRDRRLRTIGRDLTTNALREFQSDLLRKELAPMRELLEENKRIRVRHTALIDDTHELVQQEHEILRHVLRDAMRIFDLLWSQLIVATLERDDSGMTTDEIERLRIADDEKWERRADDLLDALRRKQRDAVL